MTAATARPVRVLHSTALQRCIAELSDGTFRILADGRMTSLLQPYWVQQGLNTLDARGVPSITEVKNYYPLNWIK